MKFIRLTTFSEISKWNGEFDVRKTIEEEAWIDISKAYQLRPVGASTYIHIGDSVIFVKESVGEIFQLLKEHKDNEKF